jgi:hypothetical protein
VVKKLGENAAVREAPEPVASSVPRSM